MKRFLLIIMLAISSAIVAFAQKGTVIVHSDSDSGNVKFTDVCICYKYQHFHCISVLCHINSDSIKCLTSCRAVDVSDCLPPRKTVGESFQINTINLNKHGKGKLKVELKIEMLPYPIVSDKVNTVFLKASYDINTRHFSKSTVTYKFIEKEEPEGK